MSLRLGVLGFWTLLRALFVLWWHSIGNNTIARIIAPQSVSISSLVVATISIRAKPVSKVDCKVAPSEATPASIAECKVALSEATPALSIPNLVFAKVGICFPLLASRGRIQSLADGQPPSFRN